MSYCRDDSEFALRLAEDLKAAGAAVWIDQIDIAPGERWDIEVERALISSPRMLVILSPASVASPNVLDEVSFALSKQKTVIPVIYQDCEVPFRLHRLQHVDFRNGYERGLNVISGVLAEPQSVPALQPPQKPQDWAATQDNLGTALGALADHSEDAQAAQDLQQAVEPGAAYCRSIPANSCPRTGQDPEQPWRHARRSGGAERRRAGRPIPAAGRRRLSPRPAGHVPRLIFQFNGLAP